MNACTGISREVRRERQEKSASETLNVGNLTMSAAVCEDSRCVHSRPPRRGGTTLLGYAEKCDKWNEGFNAHKISDYSLKSFVQSYDFNSDESKQKCVTNSFVISYIYGNYKGL